MFYVVQLKNDECIVRNIFRNEDEADSKYDELTIKWPNAYFDVFSEADMDSTTFEVKC